MTRKAQIFFHKGQNIFFAVIYCLLSWYKNWVDPTNRRLSTCCIRAHHFTKGLMGSWRKQQREEFHYRIVSAVGWLGNSIVFQEHVMVMLAQIIYMDTWQRRTILIKHERCYWVTWSCFVIQKYNVLIEKKSAQTEQKHRTMTFAEFPNQPKYKRSNISRKTVSNYNRNLYLYIFS